MKKPIILLMVILGLTIPPKQANAQLAIAEVIKAGVKKVIKAIDLRVQRLQNETIWLQNAQKTIENTLSKLKLDEITHWTERQRTLYKDYFDELTKVKNIVAYYHRIKTLGVKQAHLLKAYQHTWQLLKQDQHFSQEELNYMTKVYGGILDESIRNIDQISLVINSFQTKMSDAERLNIIRKAANQVDQNYFDLLQFSQENIQLSISRAEDLNEAEAIRKMYGITNTKE